jgi:hypothetical protein
VRVNGEEFSIRYRKFAVKEQTLGQCVYREARIEVATGQTPFNARDTLLHEIMHAILVKQGHIGGCFKDSTEEKYVNALATGVMGVLQDNPDVARWLVEPLGKRVFELKEKTQ